MSDMNRKMRMVLYHADDSDTAVDVVIQNDSIWATQKSMAELFSVDRSVINKHLNNIYTELDLDKEATCAKFAQVASLSRSYFISGHPVFIL